MVLLDNGRTRVLQDEVGRQALHCIRCSACLNVCPVYSRTGGHAYGSVYPGPIGAILTPQLVGIENAASLPFASSLCGACYEVCPVKIDIPTRAPAPARAGGERARRARAERAGDAARGVGLRQPARVSRSRSALGRLAQRPFVRGGVIRAAAAAARGVDAHAATCSRSPPRASATGGSERAGERRARRDPRADRSALGDAPARRRRSARATGAPATLAARSASRSSASGPATTAPRCAASEHAASRRSSEVLPSSWARAGSRVPAGLPGGVAPGRARARRGHGL